MNLLIKKGKSVDEKCSAQYLFQDDQWFNLTAHEMRRTLVNAGMKYHRPQIIPGRSLPNSTSPLSPAPMKSSFHLKLTPCDSTSTTTSMYKTCLLNTSCDHQLHLDHTNTSPELQDHSIVGSAEPESILESEDLLQLDSVSVSSQATCSIKTETNLSQTDVSLGTMTMKCSYCKRRLMHHMTISIIMSHMPVKSKIKNHLKPHFCIT